MSKMPSGSILHHCIREMGKGESEIDGRKKWGCMGEGSYQLFDSVVCKIDTNYGSG